MASTECLTLNNGAKMPKLGFGTWKAKAEGEAAQAVYEAIKAGYRHLDCAWFYQNEKEVGEGLKKALDECGLKREDIFITSKLWNNKHHPDDVEPMITKSITDLGIGYLDLYLIHWPHAYARGDDPMPGFAENGKVTWDLEIKYTDTWGAMEKCVEKGLAKSIGLSNFNTIQVQKILDVAKIKPVVNQVERTPYLNQNVLNEFCKDKGISLTAYSPLGSPDRPWAKPGDLNLLNDPRIKAIGEKHGKTPAQVLLRWQVQDGNITVIPKSVNPERIAQNAAIFDFELTAEEMKEIESFQMPNGTGRLICFKFEDGTPADYDHPDFPFKNGVDV